MHYLEVDKETVDSLVSGKIKRAICQLEGELEFHCAFNSIKGGGYYVIVNKKVCKQLDIQAGDVINVQFRPDLSEHQFEYPEVLKQVMETDPEAEKIFLSLTPGNRRGLIAIVSKIKSTDLQIERALTIAEKLKAGITSPRLILK